MNHADVAQSLEPRHRRLKIKAMISKQHPYTALTASIFMLGMLQSVLAAEPTPPIHPGITIVSPPQGTVIEPGSTVHVVIEVDPALEPQSVEVRGGVLIRETDSTAPYEFDVTLPHQYAGPAKLTTIVNGPGDAVYFGPKLNLVLMPTSAPDELDLTTHTYIVGVPVDNTRRNFIKVYGDYGGNRLKVSQPGFGVTYTSSNPGVATVEASGLIIPVSPGIAFITVEYKGFKTFAQVDVIDAQNKHHLIEHTNQVSITASGFRKEPKQGLYIQELTLRNDGDIPTPKPVHVVVSDLPPGVVLMGGSKTKTVTPIGSRSLSVEIGMRNDFWLPGATATLTLAFSNSDGRPITYTSRVFSGWP